MSLDVAEFELPFGSQYLIPLRMSRTQLLNLLDEELEFDGEILSLVDSPSGPRLNFDAPETPRQAYVDIDGIRFTAGGNWAGAQGNGAWVGDPYDEGIANTGLSVVVLVFPNAELNLDVYPYDAGIVVAVGPACDGDAVPTSTRHEIQALFENAIDINVSVAELLPGFDGEGAWLDGQESLGLPDDEQVFDWELFGGGFSAEVTPIQAHVTIGGIKFTAGDDFPDYAGDGRWGDSVVFGEMASGLFVVAPLGDPDSDLSIESDEAGATFPVIIAATDGGGAPVSTIADVLASFADNINPGVMTAAIAHGHDGTETWLADAEPFIGLLAWEPLAGGVGEAVI